MTPVHNFRQPAFREKMTQVILEVLANLPEPHRKVFIWNHYCGYALQQIAGILQCTPAEIETMLRSVDSVLYSKIQALHAEDSDHDDTFFRPTEATAQGSDQGLKRTIIPSGGPCTPLRRLWAHVFTALPC